jgi:hypothetical protein
MAPGLAAHPSRLAEDGEHLWMTAVLLSGHRQNGWQMCESSRSARQMTGVDIADPADKE